MEEAHQCETDREDAVSVSSYGGGTSLSPIMMTARKLIDVQTKYFYAELSISVGRSVADQI